MQIDVEHVDGSKVAVREKVLQYCTEWSVACKATPQKAYSERVTGYKMQSLPALIY